MMIIAVSASYWSHTGLDLFALLCQCCQASADGVVVFVVHGIIHIYPRQCPLKLGQYHVFVCFIWHSSDVPAADQTDCQKKKGK